MCPEVIGTHDGTVQQYLTLNKQINTCVVCDSTSYSHLQCLLSGPVRGVCANCLPHAIIYSMDYLRKSSDATCVKI